MVSDYASTVITINPYWNCVGRRTNRLFTTCGFLVPFLCLEMLDTCMIDWNLGHETASSPFLFLYIKLVQ